MADDHIQDENNILPHSRVTTSDEQGTKVQAVQQPGQHTTDVEQVNQSNTTSNSQDERARTSTTGASEPSRPPYGLTRTAARRIENGYGRLRNNTTESNQTQSRSEARKTGQADIDALGKFTEDRISKALEEPLDEIYEKIAIATEDLRKATKKIESLEKANAELKDRETSREARLAHVENENATLRTQLSEL